MAKTQPLNARPKSIAVVSGKGGSGKTMIAAAMAEALAIDGKRVLLVDADLGTGGLTYYLGFSAFNRARSGLTEFLISKSPSASLQIARPRSEAIKEASFLERLALLPVGEHRLTENISDYLNAASIKRLINKARGEFDFVLLDCRGGLDEDSIETCQAVDEIILVVETDAASIQASQYLSNTLYDYDLGKKIAGFVLNKVMDDPSQLATAGASFFRTEHLGSIPFDLKTTRGFIRGELPDVRSLFFRNVAASVGPLLGIDDAVDKYRPLSPKDFSNISLRNPDAGFGSMAIGLLATYGFLGYFFAVYVANLKLTTDVVNIIVSLAFALCILALSEPLKQAVGRIVGRYRSIFQQIFHRLPL